MDELDALVREVRTGGDHERVVFHLLDALPDIARLPAIGHPNGFLAIPLHEEPSGVIRLHLWSGSDPLQGEHSIHDHTYDLQSLVLPGALRQALWKVEASDDGPLEEFGVSYRGAGSEIHATGRRVSVTELDTRLLSAGDRYSVEAGAFHSIVPVQLPASTIFLKSPARRRQVGRVVGRAVPSGRLAASRSTVTEAEVAGRLAALAAALRRG